MECARVGAIPWHSVRFATRIEDPRDDHATALGFVSGASAASVLRATDELAKMMFRMHERVMKNAEMSEKLGRSKLVE
jgi:hypothetical protein